MEYSNCWLQYHRISGENTSKLMIYSNGTGGMIETAVRELETGFGNLYGRPLEAVKDGGGFGQARSGIRLFLDPALPLSGEEYRVETMNGKCTISAVSEAGLLYGSFALLRNLQVKGISDFDFFQWTEQRKPYTPIRMLNHWDNLDGTVERGYSGNSFFFEKEELLLGDRTRAYARMAASIGINAVAINNVNVKGAATELISGRYYGKLRGLAQLFAAFHIKLYLSVNFAAPMELGELETSDPCDAGVRAWWREKAEEIWSNVPELGGFLVKADSEGRPGPFTYGRTHAEGANLLAEAIRPYGGLVLWRCFVYNCRQDWRDTKTDRARAGYDNFKPLDGQFAENVILQIKNGPMDFQVREPVSPLFGGLQRTNMMLEVQLTQEYTGQQRHVCYLIPWFKEILDFPACCGKEADKVREIVSGRTYGNTNCGITAVANTGRDTNWTGHDLAGANLYGFGRLAFDAELSGSEIAREWICLTFGSCEKVTENIEKILMMSWPAYEKYTSPLGIGWMVKPGTHYGPDVDGYEYDRWGTYHRADHTGIGVDRTGQGTGYCSQYPEPLASLYSDPRTCPEELLLFFHRVRYDYVLSSGKTLLQHIYDTHYEGAREAEFFLETWKELEGLVDTEIYRRTLERLTEQKEHAAEWRDVVNSYFYRKTGIPDNLGRPLY